MLATSWKAKGLVRAAWERLDVAKDKRGELARLTGIPETNLSGMNTGRLPTTPEAARRIAQVVPGLSVEELGAPATTDADGKATSLVDHLAALAKQVAGQAKTIQRLTRRLTAVEAHLAAGQPQRDTQQQAQDDP